MPPESPDHDQQAVYQPQQQNPQLDAMRRYVEGLGREADEQQPAPRPPRAWLLIAVALSTVTLLVGIGVGLAVRPGRAEPAAAQQPSTTAASARGQVATPECKDAVDRANQSLAIAASVEGSLAEHTKIMNDLLHGKISAQAAITRGMPSLIAGASQSGRFDAALADYRNVVAQCRLRSP